MRIRIINEPSKYCFIGNMVAFELEMDLYEVVIVEIVCNGISQKTSYYPFKKGDVYHTKFSIDSYLYLSADRVEYPHEGMIVPLEGFGIPYVVKIGENYVFEGTAFRGGIGNETMARLMDEGYDIFSYRLKSHFDQFLFTTRTHSKIIKLRESELYPFVFIHPGIDFCFKSDGSEIWVDALAEDQVCVLDLDAVRDEFGVVLGKKPNTIEVWVANENAFSFVIIPTKQTEEKYLIRFKNSLGAFEMIEVTGTASHEPNISEPDIYDWLTGYGFYTQRRDRLMMQDVIKVETGYKSKDEILFISDMVCSEETYFIYADGSSFRCNVSLDKMTYLQKQTDPTSVALVITNENDSRFVSPLLDQKNLVVGTGLFDETFDVDFE